MTTALELIAKTHGGDGYDFIAIARRRGWHAIPAWGRDGWDLGDWPYVIVFVKRGARGWGKLVYCEGDLDETWFPTKDELDGSIDETAVFYWRHNGCEWVADVPAGGPVPEHLRGPYSRDRS